MLSRQHSTVAQCLWIAVNATSQEGGFCILKLDHLLIFTWVWLELTALGLAALGAVILFNPAQSQIVAMIALAVYLLLALLILVAVRYRLRRSPQWVASKCPTCGGLLYRSNRRPVNRILSFLIPVYRYYCVNPRCRWQGLRLKPLRKRHPLAKGR